MNTQYIFERIKPRVKDNKLTYDDFDKIFGSLPLKAQYQIVYAIEDELHVELVDELEEPTAEEIPAEVASLIVRQPHEIKVPNKFLIRLIQDGDEQAKQDLCVKNSGLVGKFAVKILKQYPNTLELEDLMQEGYAGMLKAAERFNFDKDTQFSTYATWWIRQAMERAIFDTGLMIRLPVHITEKINKATRLDKEFQMQNIEVRKRLELIAAQMNISVKEVCRLFELRKIYLYIVSLDMPVGEDKDTPLAEFVISEENPTYDTLSIMLLREQLDEVLGTLTAREKNVLMLRFGLEDGHERTLEDVGKIFNVTRERIRQIEAKALRKLRHPARSKKLKDFLD